jgi:O-antigen ligase
MGRFLNPDAVASPKPVRVVDHPSPPAPAVIFAPPSATPVEKYNPSHKLTFRAGLGFIFVRIAVLPELIASVLHVNTYLLYLVGPPALFGTAFGGGITRTLRHSAGKWWLALSIWMALSLPFSSWLGGSIADFKSYTLYSLPMLFTVAGLTLTWSEVRATFTVTGVAGMVIIAAAGLFATTDEGGRTDLASATGSIGNSNDLASHLILVLPFVLYIAMDKRRASMIRIAMLAPIGYALKMILGTASRGALVAIGMSFLFVLLKASWKQRMAAITAVVILTVSAPFLIRGSAVDRLASLFGTVHHEEALESQEARTYLLKESIIYTLQHPVFGVGLGQFSNFEGKDSILAGKIGNWHETHNSFTQVSSECGLPGLIFFTMGIGSAIFSVSRTYKRARKRQNTEIANVCFCYLLSMIGFMTSITFLANAFRFYLPLMIGLAIAVSTIGDKELATSQPEESAARQPGKFGLPAVRLAPS